MPIYGFQCSNCKKEEDRILPMSEMNVKQVCTVCGYPMVRQVSMPQRPQFHGSGFYETDYVGKKSAN